ncbi:MAG: GNAT family N-acetyltransferase [Nitrososphaerota archaeon]|nr:GNAT family N-acetyltransferase [Nitrososphaerota archaeon]MDG6924239.1 GNAT family N-acetyltransferase [Nitrososphaerota archaeon]
MSGIPTGVEIRQSTDDDWPQVLDLYDSLSEDDLGFRFLNLHHLTADEAKRISQHKNHITLLAVKGRRVIGEAALEEDGEISVVVSKDCREGGVGVSLLRSLIEMAKLGGTKCLKFFCSPSNTRMAQLGSSVGFKLTKHYGIEDKWTINLCDP